MNYAVAIMSSQISSGGGFEMSTAPAAKTLSLTQSDAPTNKRLHYMDLKKKGSAPTHPCSVAEETRESDGKMKIMQINKPRCSKPSSSEQGFKLNDRRNVMTKIPPFWFWIYWIGPVV